MSHRVKILDGKSKGLKLEEYSYIVKDYLKKLLKKKEITPETKIEITRGKYIRDTFGGSRFSQTSKPKVKKVKEWAR